MSRFSALLFLMVPALGQGLTLGAKGGLRLTGDAPEYGTSDSRRYAVGPMIEVGLPFHFAFEAAALYSRLGNTFLFPLVGNEAKIRTIANSWAFPILLKYRLPGRKIHPFVSTGIAPRHASGATHTIHYGFLPGDITFSSTHWAAHDHALVAGGGIDVRCGRIRISPELRYVRRHISSHPSPDDAAYYNLSRSNEAQLLLGIAWAAR